LVIVAVLFGLLILLIYNKFEKNYALGKWCFYYWNSNKISKPFPVLARILRVIYHTASNVYNKCLFIFQNWIYL
jgi:hypothetical protein